jgi:transposase
MAKPPRKSYPLGGTKVLIPDKEGNLKERPRLYLPREETDRRLDAFEAEAQAGMPDAELARMAKVSVTTVRLWRRKKEIRHSKAPDRRATIAKAMAMNLLGEPLDDVLQRVQSSELEGEWRPPEYVVRVGINYNKMMEQCHVLLAAGYSIEAIAEAHGYTQQTVRQALGVYVRYLKEQGG